MTYTIIVLCLAAVIAAYFLNNPLKHSRWFILRRFINWFPLGMTYAFLYMGRYNLVVAKNALGPLLSNENFGWIFGAGTIVYGLSFLVNGPLIDRIGGKRGILISAIGASAMNALLGVVTHLRLQGRLPVKLGVAFTVIYALNMYFQSYGAVSIIKVKAYWFHVRERGVFGAIFGTLISLGVYFAFDWGQAITDHLPTGDVFFIPAAILVFWAVLDVWLIKDTPEEAGLPAFDTHDASSGQMHVELSTGELLMKVFGSPLMLLIAVVEFTSGVFRNGITQWYFIFAKQVAQPGAQYFLHNWGFLLAVFGIIGGFAGGLISDKLFRSRRGPPAALLCGAVAVAALVMSGALFSSPALAGWMGVLIVTCSVGITSLMSGTAATDFGGRKATATASGIVDGFAYLGSSVQSFCLGYITTWHWQLWPLFLVPFALVGLWIAIKIWHELPAATRRYIAEVEIGAPPSPAEPAAA